MNLHYRKWLSSTSAERSASLKGSHLTDSLGFCQVFIFSGGYVYRKIFAPLKKKIRLDNYLQCQQCRNSLIRLNHSTFNETNPVQFCPFAKSLPIQVQAAQASVSNSCQRDVFSESNPLYSHLLQSKWPMSLHTSRARSRCQNWLLLSEQTLTCGQALLHV